MTQFIGLITIFIPSNIVYDYVLVYFFAAKTYNFFHLFVHFYRGHVPLGSVIFSEGETSPTGECFEDLYCGPFRNRTALLAILPDEASDGCGVFCELFYIVFSSAIGLPLIFCLM